jgi:hypothetical protein
MITAFLKLLGKYLPNVICMYHLRREEIASSFPRGPFMLESIFIFNYFFKILASTPKHVAE